MQLTPIHGAVEFLTRQLLEAEMEATLEEGGEPVRKDTSPVNRLGRGPKFPPWRTTVQNLDFKP